VPPVMSHLLDRTGVTYQLQDHSDVLGLPAYSVSIDGQQIARAVCVTPEQALGRVTEQALLHWQGHVAGRPELVRHEVRWPQPGGDGPEPGTVARALRRATGLTPVAVPLPRTVLAFVSRVVLCHD
jgi:hypothetical protein